nr:unnamed protein product [Digitaria exilis]
MLSGKASPRRYASFLITFRKKRRRTLRVLNCHSHFTTGDRTDHGHRRRRRDAPLDRAPTRFALCLYAALTSSTPLSATAPSNSSNTIFSPLSIHVALGLLAAGSGGATRDQLLAALAGGGAADGLHALGEEVARVVLADGAEAGGPRIAFADAVFVDASLKLKSAFEEVAVEKYNAETLSVDFQNKVDRFA